MSNRGGPNRGPSVPRVRINTAIRAREVRLIGEDGAQLGVIALGDALRMAQDADLDLVEVQANVDPPVCRLMDYGRHKYEQERKERENRRAQKTVELKEMRLRPDTDRHDLETKKRQVEGWLGSGNKVQLTIRMRGREQAHPDVARRVLSTLADAVSAVGFVERDVLAEGRAMTMILAPGVGRRAASARATSADE